MVAKAKPATLSCCWDWTAYKFIIATAELEAYKYFKRLNQLPIRDSWGWRLFIMAKDKLAASPWFGSNWITSNETVAITCFRSRGSILFGQWKASLMTPLDFSGLKLNASLDCLSHITYEFVSVTKQYGLWKWRHKIFLWFYWKTKK